TQLVFARDGGGTHHEVRSLARLAARKRAEGAADVRLARRYPHLTRTLRLARLTSPSALGASVLRAVAFSGRPLGDRLARVLIALVGACDRYKLRGTWRRVHGALITLAYSQGVASEVGSEDALRQLVRAAGPAERALSDRWLD